MLTIECGDIVTAFETLPFYELLNVFSGFDIADNVLYLMNERVSHGYVVIEDYCIYMNGFAYPYTTARLTPRSKNGEHWVQFDIDNSCTGVNVSFIVLG